MTVLGQRNHYNVKLLKGYGVSINLKDSKICLKGGSDPFTCEQETEEWFVTQIPHERIVISGKGYRSTEAVKYHRCCRYVVAPELAHGSFLANPQFLYYTKAI